MNSGGLDDQEGEDIEDDDGDDDDDDDDGDDDNDDDDGDVDDGDDKSLYLGETRLSLLLSVVMVDLGEAKLGLQRHSLHGELPLCRHGWGPRGGRGPGARVQGANGQGARGPRGGRAVSLPEQVNFRLRPTAYSP